MKEPALPLSRAVADAAARAAARTGAAARYDAIRRTTVALAAPLSPEDAVIQSMPEASPTKWHLAHTSWFFETFVLAARAGYCRFDERFNYLFNSYYEAVGPRHCRPRRGLLSRPSLEEVLAYRRYVDDAMRSLLAREGAASEAADIVELGLQHEQQHQELLLTDIQHALWSNPLRPAYGPAPPPGGPAPPVRFRAYPGGVRAIGHGGEGFAFDNEMPRHRVFLEPFALASRLVTNAEYRAFVEDDGYRRPELWLSDGWNVVRTQGWTAPLYWERDGDAWAQFTLGGMAPVAEGEPVAHVSYYEADAFARWAGARLPTEAEWEVAAADTAVRGNFVESGRLQPSSAIDDTGEGLLQLFGDVWEWTRSAYDAYPGFVPARGALGEYNGKFMCNQMVLRGGSCATPAAHVRATYRNFFLPDARWQWSGIRLARDASA